MHTSSIMEELEQRREREKHFAINTTISLRVTKPFTANLQVKGLVHGSSTSELARVLMDLGAKQLGWDLDAIS